MNIAHCIFTMYTGGAQMLVVDILNGLCNDHEASLIIVNNEVEESIISKLDKKVKVFTINRPKGSRNPYYILKLNYFLQLINPDVVHCHEANMIDLFVIRRFKSLLTIHDVAKIVPNRNKYDKLISISNAVSLDFKTRYNYNTRVVNNGVDMAYFTKRNNYNFLEKDKFNIVQISRLMHAKKGQDILVKAIALIRDKYKIDNIVLDFIGDGESFKYLNKLVIELELQKQVDFLGNQSREWIAKNINKYHTLVQPSRYEGFGLTIVEGISAGIPVIASNIEGPAEILNKLDYNFLFEVEDIQGCAQKIIDIYKLYTNKKVDKMMQNSYELIKNTYDINHTIAGYLNVYQNM